jgi:hypothetical protein
LLYPSLLRDFLPQPSTLPLQTPPYSSHKPERFQTAAYSQSTQGPLSINISIRRYFLAPSRT